MTCDDFKELISARLDGELTPDESRALEQHFLECAECAQFASGLDELSAQIARQSLSDMPGNLADKILSATVGNDRPQSVGQRILSYFGASYRIPRVAVWGGGVALLLLLGKIAFMPAISNDVKSPSSGKTAPPAASQKIVLTEKDVVSIDGLRVQRVELSDADVATTVELSTTGQTKQ